MPPSRTYQSPLRDERARDTRRRIRASARELFTDRGFANTTVTAIARHAGVAPQTVYAAFGNKANLVAAMLGELEEAAGEAAWLERVWAEPEPRKQLELFLAWLRALFEEGAPILRAASAARADPDVEALLTQGDAHRRDGIRQLVEAWSRGGALRPDLDPAEATDRFWLLTHLEPAFLALDRLGWSLERYERWLQELLERELFGPEAHRGETNTARS